MIQDVLNAATGNLRGVHAKSAINQGNIEDIFSAIDMGHLIGRYGGRDPDAIDRLANAVRVFIARTIEETVTIPQANGRFGSTPGYGPLADLVAKHLLQYTTSERHSASVIDFNYDTCLEFEFSRLGAAVEYGLNVPFLESADNDGRFQIPILKLHGSINWFICNQCEQIVPVEINPMRHWSPIDLLDQPNEIRLRYYGKYRQKRHGTCGGSFSDVPFLVPPTWDKASGSKGLASVWRRAAEELAAADNIVVIGYSMPVTDTFFKYLFALGVDSDVDIEKFVVIYGPDGGECERRFRNLLGPAVPAQAFEPYAFKFSGSIRILEQILGGASS